MNRSALKRFSAKLAPVVLAFISVPGVPARIAPQAALNRPVAELVLAPRASAGPYLPAEVPEAASMLLAGGALMALGLVGRKRRAEKTSERR